MEISQPDFGIDLVARDNRFHAAANGRPVVPVETLAVAKNRCVDIRHQRGSAKSFGNDALGDIALSEYVPVFDRRYVSNFNPRRPGETTGLLGNRLPAEPILHKQSQPAAVKA